MSRQVVNLAAAPFVNGRPLRRLVVLLWTLGSALLVINVALYWNYRDGSVEARSRLQDLRKKVRGEDQAIVELEKQTRNMDLTGQREQVIFLNQMIDERTFPWGTLFEDLTVVLPGEVRLRSLAPEVVKPERRPRDRGSRRSRSRRAPAPYQPTESRIRLRISGIANGDAHLDFIQNLFEHPAFADPEFPGDKTEDQRQFGFELNVTYFPQRGQRAAGAEPASAPGPTGSAGDDDASRNAAAEVQEGPAE